MAGAADITRAVRLLAAGELVALPTETVYGLAADATSEAAVAKIFAAKGRPTNHPLIVHLADGSWLEDWTEGVDDHARALASAFWPGPLTMILRRPSVLPLAVTGGLDTVAVRVPDHPLTRSIISELGRPIAAPSANRFGSVSPTRAEHVVRDLGDQVAMVVDGGPCEVGIESTIVDLVGASPAIARLGMITASQIEAVLHEAPTLLNQGEVPAPGALPSHYAPAAEVELVALAELADRTRQHAENGRRVAALYFTDELAGLDPRVIDASLSSDLERGAKGLYAKLRQLDDLGVETIVASAPTPDGVGRAIADRLIRAASKG